MTDQKNVTMCKSGRKDISVNPDSVEVFADDGWKRSDGKAAAPANEGTGMTDAEKQVEIDAAGEVARKKAKKAGQNAAEITAAVDAAKADAEAELSDD